MNRGPRATKTTRVAVVVTCFNSGNTLPETIASIDACGMPVELVVVDDGSGDKYTHEVLAELETEGVQVIRQHNLGQAAATNTGIAATVAPYVMRFDSDDLLEPGALGELADALDRAPAAAVVWGDYQTFGLTTFAVPGAVALDPWLVTYVNLIPGSGALFRRVVLDAVGGWRLGAGFEDWDLWMTLAERGYAGVYVPRTVFRYRRLRGYGRQSQASPATNRYYDGLISEHGGLVQRRRQNMRRSRAPTALKLLVPIVEALPFISRLSKINACELLARSLWSRTPRAALEILRQGLALRGRARLGRE